MELLFKLVADILGIFYAFIPNYAVAIVLLTCLVMAITTPLTLKSTRSMMVMQKLQPDMKKIQAKYKDDRQKQNEELLKFYKENNINPLGGCIPLLVQMPVFFFLYAVLRGLTRRISDVGFQVGWNTGQAAINTNLTTAPPWLQNFDPAYLDHNSLLYQNLSSTNTMQALGMDLSQSLTETWSHKGALASVPYVILIAIVAVTSFYQQRQIQGRNPNAAINPQQQTLMKIMPIILPLISLNLPAALVLYFAVSNLWRVGLQAFISRSIYGIKKGEKPEGGTKADRDAPKSSKPGPTSNGKGQATKAGGATKKAASTATKKKAPADGAGGNGRKKQPAAAGNKATSKTNGAAKPTASGSKSSNGGRGSSRATAATNKNPSASKSRSSQRSPSGSGSAGEPDSPSLQPRARKPKKR